MRYRLKEGETIQLGSQVKVVRKDGREDVRTIQEFLWSGIDDDGVLVGLFTVEPVKREAVTKMARKTKKTSQVPRRNGT